MKMEFTSLILPPIKNICRTCLLESDAAMLINVQDLIEHEMYKVKLIDILVFLNCLEVRSYYYSLNQIYFIISVTLMFVLY